MVPPRRPWFVIFDARALTLGLLVTLALAAGALAKQDKGPTSFEELREVIVDKNEGDQRERLARFARDGRVALSDRLLALSAWRRQLDKDAPEHVDIDLYEAHLRTLGNAQGLREKALRRAAKGLREQLEALQREQEEAEKRKGATKRRAKKRRAKKRRANERSANKRGDDDKPRPAKVIERDLQEVTERLEHVTAVRGGDDALTKLRRALRARAKAHRRTPADAGEAAAVLQVTEALPHYDALDDERQLAEAKLGLALFLEHSDASRADVDRALKRLVRVGGRKRDLARVRQKVRRARARVLEEQGDMKEAVHESLVADRTVSVPLHKPAFERPPAPAYGRSRTTAELCWRAYARGLRCAEIEEARSGKLSFYDYAQERRRSFDHERARMVIAEYEPLLLRCLSEAASSGRSVTNTTVQLEWAIELDGHVREFSMTPRRLRGSPLERCFKAAFARFRYPRYRGEMQHTQLSFNVGG